MKFRKTIQYTKQKHILINAIYTLVLFLFSNTVSLAINISEIAHIKKDLIKVTVAISSEGNHILIGNQEQTTITYASGSGEILWEYELPLGIEMESGAISKDGELIVVGGQGGIGGMQDTFIFLFSKNGDLLWKKNANGEIPVGITDNGDRIFAADYNKTLKCYDKKGELLWSKKKSTGDGLIWDISISKYSDLLLLQYNYGLMFCDKNGKELKHISLSPQWAPFSAYINFSGSKFSLLYTNKTNSKKYLEVYAINSSNYKFSSLFKKEIMNYGEVTMDEFDNIYLSIREDMNYLYDINGNLIHKWSIGGYDIDASKNGQTIVVGGLEGCFIYEVTDLCNITDSDGDGVIDQWDKCPETPINSYVNKIGCSATNNSAISGRILIKGNPLIQGTATLIQSGELFQKSPLDKKGCFNFNKVVEDKSINIMIRKPIDQD